MKIVIAILMASLCGCGTKILSRKAYEIHIITAYHMGLEAGINLPFSECANLKFKNKLEAK